MPAKIFAGLVTDIVGVVRVVGRCAVVPVLRMSLPAGVHSGQFELSSPGEWRKGWSLECGADRAAPAGHGVGRGYAASISSGVSEQRGQPVDLAGTWRLKSAYFVAHGTGDRLDVLGAQPFGYAVFESSGRMISLLTSAAGTRAASAGDPAALHTSMVAYTGSWSIDGDKFVVQVDGAWDPSWVGTEQVRYFTFDGRTLSIRTAPLDHPSFPGEKVIGYVDWEKEA
jgi:hypothetical protein